MASADRVTLYGLMVKPIQRFPQFILLLQVRELRGAGDTGEVLEILGRFWRAFGEVWGTSGRFWKHQGGSGGHQGGSGDIG